MTSTDLSTAASPEYTRGDVDRMFDGSFAEDLKEDFIKYLAVAPMDDTNAFHACHVTVLQEFLDYGEKYITDPSAITSIKYAFASFIEEPSKMTIEELINNIKYHIDDIQRFIKMVGEERALRRHITTPEPSIFNPAKKARTSSGDDSSIPMHKVIEPLM